MPIHDWTRVEQASFTTSITPGSRTSLRVLNRGLLPPTTTPSPSRSPVVSGRMSSPCSVPRATDRPLRRQRSAASRVATAPPKVLFRHRAETDQYAAKAKAVVVRHASDHRVIAVVEIVSPGNKTPARHPLVREQGGGAARGRVHLLIIDLFPPGPRDPQGIHRCCGMN